MSNERIIELRMIISNRMIELLNTEGFELSIRELTGIHEYLFRDIYFNNGGFRKFNISREEDILYDDSLDYPDFHVIPISLRFAINDELKVDYSKLSEEEKIKNIAAFSAKIWHVHPFNDGNTRTTSIFIQKYLKKLGYTVDNDIFKENALYYRTALVKANYQNVNYDIKPDLNPLIKFYQKVLLDNTIELDFNDLYIDGLYLKKEASKKKKRIKRNSTKK